MMKGVAKTADEETMADGARTKEVEAEVKTMTEEAAEADPRMRAGRVTPTISMCGTTTARPATEGHPRQIIGGPTPAEVSAVAEAEAEVAAQEVEAATATTSRETPTFTPTMMTTTPRRSQY